MVDLGVLYQCPTCLYVFPAALIEDDPGVTCACDTTPRIVWAPQDAAPMPFAQLCAALRVLVDDLPKECLFNGDGSLREALVDVLTVLAQHPQEE
jgi:hypothetical protein